MKKLFCAILLILLSFSLFTACGAKKTVEQNTEPPAESAEAIKDEIYIVIEANIDKRIEIFLQKNFSTDKMVIFDGLANMSEELSRLVFETALYKGAVHVYSWKTDEGLSKEMIEDNIQAVFGPDIIAELDYDYICADYDEERSIYIPWQNSTPLYACPYVFHSIENDHDNIYKAVVSQIFTDGDIFSLDAEGNSVIPEHIRRIYADSDSYEAREEAKEALKQDILQKPAAYQRIEMLIEAGEDDIHILSAKKI